MNVSTEFLERSCAAFADRPALIFAGQTTTYRELLARVDGLATALAGRGIRARDRVILFLPNIPELIVSYYAVQKLGACAVALNSTLKHDEVLYSVNDSQARGVVTTKANGRLERSANASSLMGNSPDCNSSITASLVTRRY